MKTKQTLKARVNEWIGAERTDADLLYDLAWAMAADRDLFNDFKKLVEKERRERAKAIEEYK